MSWLRALLERLGIVRPTAPPIGKVVYASGACSKCGGRSAVLEGLCWYCRTGNEPVTEPMVWDG